MRLIWKLIWLAVWAAFAGTGSAFGADVSDRFKDGLKFSTCREVLSAAGTDPARLADAITRAYPRLILNPPVFVGYGESQSHRNRQILPVLVATGMVGPPQPMRAQTTVVYQGFAMDGSLVGEPFMSAQDREWSDLRLLYADDGSFFAPGDVVAYEALKAHAAAHFPLQTQASDFEIIEVDRMTRSDDMRQFVYGLESRYFIAVHQASSRAIILRAASLLSMVELGWIGRNPLQIELVPTHDPLAVRVADKVSLGAAEIRATSRTLADPPMMYESSRDKVFFVGTKGSIQELADQLKTSVRRVAGDELDELALHRSHRVQPIFEMKSPVTQSSVLKLSPIKPPAPPPQFLTGRRVLKVSDMRQSGRAGDIFPYRDAHVAQLIDTQMPDGTRILAIRGPSDQPGERLSLPHGLGIDPKTGSVRRLYDAIQGVDWDPALPRSPVRVTMLSSGSGLSRVTLESEGENSRLAHFFRDFRAEVGPNDHQVDFGEGIGTAPSYIKRGPQIEVARYVVDRNGLATLYRLTFFLEGDLPISLSAE